jgi:biopolymer transport protein ExbD
MLRQRLRYADTHQPRVEMTPLLDVIFLLLTFFIYSIVLTVRAQVLPVKLPALSTGEIAQGVQIAGITVDLGGRFYLNQQLVTRTELEARLQEMAARPDPPRFFLAVDAQSGSIDRAPILLEMIEMLRRLKIEDFSIVGRPAVTESRDRAAEIEALPAP